MDKLNPIFKPKISVEINDGTPEIAVEDTKAIETGIPLSIVEVKNFYLF